MAMVLDKRYTSADSLPSILKAIEKLASDNNHRVLVTDEVEWLERKMGEVLRLTRLARRKARRKAKARD